MNHFSQRLLLLIIYFLIALRGVAQDAPLLHPPPGRLVDVGGWTLHLTCTGTKNETSPTVVLEAGAGDFSPTWTFVQPKVASFARVCSYDRSDTGWSDLGPHPRTFHQIAYELRTLLKNAGEYGPFVLVGHSLGGLYARTFLMEYPQDVAGMVLVDSAHENELLFTNGRFTRIVESAQQRSVPSAQTSHPLRESEIPADIMRALTESAMQMARSANDPPYNKLPPEIQLIRTWAMSQPKYAAASDNPFEPEERAALLATIHSTPLGDRPLVVLTRGNPVYVGDLREQRQKERDEQQKELVALSRKGEQRIVMGSDHEIQIDAPDAVVRAIRDVISGLK
jgi:pimeloyl-ACP methyl ester carboxylesterase